MQVKLSEPDEVDFVHAIAMDGLVPMAEPMGVQVLASVSVTVMLVVPVLPVLQKATRRSVVDTVMGPAVIDATGVELVSAT